MKILLYACGPLLFSILLLNLAGCKNETNHPPAGQPEHPATPSDTTQKEISLDTVIELTGSIADTAAARLYLKQAETLNNQYQHDKALDLVHRSIRIYHHYLPEYDTLTATAFTALALTHYNLLQYDSCRMDAQKAIEISTAASGTNNKTEASAYNLIAVSYFGQGKFNEAVHYFKKSLDIFKTLFGRINNDVASNYSSIGYILGRQDKFEESIDHLNQALEIWRELYGMKSEEVATVYNNLGIVMRRMGDLDKAAEYYYKTLEINSSNNASISQQTAITFENLGNIYQAKGDFEKTMQVYSKALKIWNQLYGDLNPQSDICYKKIGSAHEQMKQYELALDCYNKAIELSCKKSNTPGPDLAAIYNSRGIVYRRMNRPEEALRDYEQAKKIWVEAFGPSHQDVAAANNNIGKALTGMGRYEDALRIQHRALRDKMDKFGPQSHLLAINYESIGFTYTQYGKLDEAIQSYEKGMQSLQFDIGQPSPFYESPNLSQLRNILLGINRAYNIQFQKKQDRRILEKISQVTEILLSLENYLYQELIGAENRKFYSSESWTVYENAMDHFFREKDRNKIPVMFQISEISKGRSLAEKINKDSYQTAFGIPDSLTEKEHRIEREIGFMDKKKYREKFVKKNPNDSLLNIYNQKILSLKEERNKLVEYFKLHFPDYYSLRYGFSSIGIPGIQDSLLSEQQALVEYFTGDSSLFAFTILKDTFFVRRIQKDFPLEDWVHALRCGIFSGFTQASGTCTGTGPGNPEEQYSALAHQLYQKIFAPIDSLLPDGTDLTIVPDGVLGYLPFDALLVEEPEPGQSPAQYHYLLRDHAISYAYSATLQQEMTHRKHRKEPSKNLLAFAPSFGDETDLAGDTALLASRSIDISSRRNWLSPLKYNRAEATAIASTMEGDVVTGQDATEQAFVAMASDYRILHLSTHGKANDQVGDYSFLAFQEIDDSLENEWLYNRELYNLDLNADLVVLSACETGIGELQRGEGIISLARGFSYAGAKSIVTSLWSVNDQSTMALMELFYQHLKSGMNKDKALRQAKLDYLSNYPNLGSEPFFWAAFIPIGDMSPVSLPGNAFPYWWLVAGFLLLAGWLGWRSRPAHP